MKDENYDIKIPRFFFGLSMGALIGYFTVLKNPSYFKGILMLCPAF
jgi:predicted alpha/beta superfamily hydrolase